MNPKLEALLSLPNVKDAELSVGEGIASSARVLPDDHRELEPPDPIPNSEVKRLIADGSVGGPM